ncbi:5-formyltetrahydrofolate cyclo-ligase [Dactylosporangium aurantiacum]|uniref:5-formyltetrahydrofolate cyclo-ligase n=1 Tax=Dactylosporangium aurantiacum TaxID=35754 RepID=A0A9Q9IUR7_9ACTN|nr:5-formyltetrahydrofolate cyclo-ligase [Dactylosporangium aurantiacum]MDG6100519.1 5-formyltetrahydrofolate cyclo-ligase [Dactylosporangium aurantiacum]UWZ59338.1 5-formyltetrahydrofolate cyclo-ligase [Dactylosporangium aurantiacum]
MSPKSELRSHIRSARRALPAATRDASDKSLISAFSAIVRASHARTVAAYVPLAYEPGGAGLLDALAAAVPRLLLPVLLPSRDLDWAVYDGTLTPGPLGLSEPPGPRLGADAVRAVDLMLVPALAVGLDGTRLGQGGGSYDRVLPRVSAPTVAPLHPGELLPAVPAEPHDQRVRAAVVGATTGYETAHLHWTKGCAIPHYWHSIGLSANDGG